MLQWRSDWIDSVFIRLKAGFFSFQINIYLKILYSCTIILLFL